MTIPHACGFPRDLYLNSPAETFTLVCHHYLYLIHAEMAGTSLAMTLLAVAAIDEIDRDAHLSREGKARQRHAVATKAFADFEASKTLARAREAVELAVAKHNIEPEVRDATLKAMNQAEQGWQKAIDKIAERASLTRPWTHKPAAISGWPA
jgi:hypothetical protein